MNKYNLLFKEWLDQHLEKLKTDDDATSPEPHEWIAEQVITLRAENERLLNENKELNIRIENLTMSPDHRVRVQAVKHMLEMTAFLRKIMTLGLLRGSPRLRDEALRILDGVEPSNYDGSATQNTNPDFNNH